MLSNFHHKIIGSTLHRRSRYWELLYHALNIADRDRRLVMSFIASPISQSLPCSFIYGWYLGSDMLLKSLHKKLSGPLFIAYRHCKYIMLHRVPKVSQSPSLRRIVIYAYIKSLILRCAMRDVGSKVSIFPNPRYNISLIMRLLHFIAHILISNFPLQSPMR